MSALLASPAWGESGDTHTLPPRGPLKYRMRMNVDLHWADGNGYRPIGIELVPIPAPAPAERQFRVVVKPSNAAMEVSRTIVLPEGSTGVKETILVPQDDLWHYVYLDVYENGRKLPDFGGYLPISRNHHWNWTEASPCVLFIDKDVPLRPQREAAVLNFRSTGTDKSPTYNLPDFRNLMRIFPETQFTGMMVSNGGRRDSDALLLNQLADTHRAEMLSPAELPEQWLGYTSFDMAFISLADLQLLARSEPQRFAALTDWLRTGPILCVYGVGGNYQRLAELEQLLELPTLPHPADDERSRYRGWQEPDVAKRDDDLPQYGQYSYASGGQRILNVPPTTSPGSASSTNGPRPEVWPFVLRPASMGYVVALNDDNPFPGDRNSWLWLLNSVPDDRWMWYQRHGLSLHRPNDDFWNFLIPGVGMAPVVSFLLLITLFAAVIGPVNYIVLGRWRRLYLLLITVPVGALLVTGSLFLYAVATDGLGVRTRVRSFTELDAKSGRAVSWSRQSYYASVAPSRGLQYPEHAAAYPIVYQPTTRSGQRSVARRMEWGDEQNLRSGYIASRTATQLLVINAARSQSRLIVKPQDNLPPRVQNELGTDIHYLLVAARHLKQAGSNPSSEGKWITLPGASENAPARQVRRPQQTFWQVRNLQQGQQATLEPVELADARRIVNDIYGDNPLELPTGYDPTMQNTMVEMMLPSYRYLRVDQGMSPPRAPTSVLEQNLSILAHRGDTLLEPGAFLAVSDRPPEVPLGVAEAREQQSLHVIHGRW